MFDGVGVYNEPDIKVVCQKPHLYSLLSFTFTVYHTSTVALCVVQEYRSAAGLNTCSMAISCSGPALALMGERDLVGKHALAFDQFDFTLDQKWTRKFSVSERYVSVCLQR